MNKIGVNLKRKRMEDAHKFEKEAKQQRIQALEDKCAKLEEQLRKQEEEEEERLLADVDMEGLDEKQNGGNNVEVDGSSNNKEEKGVSDMPENQ